LKKEQYRTDISDFDFEVLSQSVCKEEVEKLKDHRPTTIFAASRIPGIRPTTLIFLHQYVRKNSALRQANVVDESASDLKGL